MMKEDNKNFLFDCNSPILLYGENQFACTAFRNLTEAGYCVKGFIDQKYKSVQKDAQCIKMSIEHIQDVDNIDTYIIIVCLRNGIQHDYVAEQLYRYGVNKIIYLPMHIKNTLYNRQRYRQVYQLITSFAYDEIKNVPIYTEKKNEIIVIRRNSSWISFWCPIEYLHSATSVMIEEKGAKISKFGKQYFIQNADIPIIDSKPYIELFKFLEGNKNSNIDLYISVMNWTDGQKLLNDREELYGIYQENFRYDFQFFLDSPARGRWNNKGYFNIEDGMHRIFYLYSKGYIEVPVVVTVEEFTTFTKIISDKMGGQYGETI